MAPESATGKSKNLFAQLGFPRPRSSRTPSRSTSPNPSNLPTTHQEPQQHGLENPVKTAWKATEVALRLLEKSADVFPPLKSAVGGLVACLDLAKNVTGNQEEYVKLAKELEEMADTLRPHSLQLAAEGARGSIALILKSIDEELVGIKEQQERSNRKKIVEAADDKGDILMRYRKIDSLFRRLLSDVTLRTNIQIGKLSDTTSLRTLKPVDDARYDSEYSTTVQRRGCTASTREQILKDLRAWAKDSNGCKVFWMNGMAGTGKTTILYSFCEWLEENKRLAGNFFCSRASTACRDLNNIVRSIAYQLAHYSPAFRSALCKILEEKQNPHTLNVGEQFKWMVEKPLQNSKDAIPDGVVIIIDALDECNNVSATALFLKVLLQYSTHLPIKFMVASRPEPVILKNMQTPTFSPSVLRLHDIEQSLVEADIKLYLQEALSTMSPALTPDVLDRLTKQAGKLFIYAATVARYVNPDDDEVDSETRLDAVLGISSSSASLQAQELDSLYRSILSSAFDKTRLEERELKIASLVLQTVICAMEPMTTSMMSTILALRQGDVARSLFRLQSVLHVQEGPSGLVSVLHASFPEFLCNEARSREFYCNTIEHNTTLAHCCFNVMYKELHFNMCDLESSYHLDKDVPGLKQKIRANISAALLYACKYWSNHLMHCDLTSSIHERLIKFLKFHLLFWMEVLNLTESIKIGSQMLSNTINWFIRKTPDHMLKEMEKELYDADLFVKTFSLGACKKSTPHIYISALPFCYKSNSVYQNYWSKTNGLLEVSGTSLNQQHNGPIGVWKTYVDLNTVAFSKDGHTFAVGFQGGINVRDVQSGEIVFSPLLGNEESIISMVFSNDNCKVAAGSGNGNIWIWDIQTANLIAGPLSMKEGDPVSSLAFSGDSRKLASYSGCTIVIWDSSSGKVLSGPFKTELEDQGCDSSSSKAPSGSFEAEDLELEDHVCDSSSSKVLSGPFKTELLEDHVCDSSSSKAPSGSFEAKDSELEDHGCDSSSSKAPSGSFETEDSELEDYSSFAFTPDDSNILLVSDIGTVYILDAHTGSDRAEPFEITDPEGAVGLTSTAISPDTTMVAIGYEEGMICIWDIHARTTIHSPFVGHKSSISALAFSQDGKKLISGSYDTTIQIWDVGIGNAVGGPFKGHNDTISSLALSSDGTKMISGSYDQSVCLWNVFGNKSSNAPPCQSVTAQVSTVAWSPDGTRIAFGQDDGTIAVWDALNGEAVGVPSCHSSPIWSIAFSPDGSRISAGNEEGAVVSWDSRTGEMVGKPFQGHSDAIVSVVYSPDGSKVASGSTDSTIIIWNCSTGEMIGKLLAHNDQVNAVVFTPDSNKLVSGGEDHLICVWDVHTGQIILGPIKGHKDAVLSVACSPDGTQFVCGSLDNTLHVWNLTTGEMTAGHFDAHCSPVQSVAYSRDGTKIISGFYNGTVCVSDAKTSNILASIAGHTSSVESLAVSPDGTKFVSGSWEGSVHVWQLDILTSPELLRNTPTIWMPEDVIVPTLSNIAEYHEDGWVVLDNKHLFWAPLEFREDLCYPYNPITIGPNGTTRIDYSPSNLFIGRMWSKCWIYGRQD